jgi:hypothetical protein
VNGYASPTSRAAPVALGVNTAAYSSGDALKCASTLARARSTSSVAAALVGFTECGLPNSVPDRRSACARYWARAARPAPV